MFFPRQSAKGTIFSLIEVKPGAGCRGHAGLLRHCWLVFLAGDISAFSSFPFLPGLPRQTIRDRHCFLGNPPALPLGQPFTPLRQDASARTKGDENYQRKMCKTTAKVDELCSGGPSGGTKAPCAMEQRFCAAQSTEQNHFPAALLVTFQAPLAVLLRPPDTEAEGNKQEIEG